MKPVPSLTREAFDELIREHHALVHLANELELQLYHIGDQHPPSAERIAACQQAAGDLISRLRQTLFRFDQQVYPLLDPLES